MKYSQNPLPFPKTKKENYFSFNINSIVDAVLVLTDVLICFALYLAEVLETISVGLKTSILKGVNMFVPRLKAEPVLRMQEIFRTNRYCKSNFDSEHCFCVNNKFIVTYYMYELQALQVHVGTVYVQ